MFCSKTSSILLALISISFTDPFALGAAVTTSSLDIYSTSSLGDINATDSCIEALTTAVTCYPGLSKAVTQVTSWTSSALGYICTENCTSSLQDYISSVNDACGSSTIYNISGTMQYASSAGEEMRWRQNATCLKDASLGEYCNLYLQEAVTNGTSGVQCSDCYLNYLSDLVNSQWGQNLVDAAYFEDKVSNCSATGYSVTYTATATSSSATSTATTVSTSRCNVTDPDADLYTVSTGDTCLSISSSQNVSTSLLTSTNGLDSNCSYLSAGYELCLPKICEIYLVKTNDTCTSIMASLDRKISLPNLISWNANINYACSNIDSLVGTYICISPLGDLSLPDTFPLQPATTAVAVPTNAVSTSNTDCGYWYTVQKGDTCAIIADEFGIDLEDFYFLNPQLGSSCGSLWTGNSYCVEAVGNIAAYSGYSGTTNTTTSYTSLASSINVSITRTVNRTTTHFFYSYPPITTSTAPYNSSAVSILATYTLCSAGLAYYDLNSTSDLTDISTNPDDEDWYDEYQRVCIVNPDALPTVGFNTSLTLAATTTADVSTASAGASVTTVTATATSAGATATSTGLTISEDGTCGSGTGYTCAGSTLGDCCSIYGYCGSTTDYCSTYCDSSFGDCDTTSTSTSTSTSATASATSASNISPDGTCGSGTGYTCAGSTFGNCCSIYGYCGSTTDYCSTYCDSAFGDCDTTSTSTSTSAAASATSASNISPDGTCGPDYDDYTCVGSSFGDCCSNYGYCGSTTDYCSSANCNSLYGTCSA